MDEIRGKSSWYDVVLCRHCSGLLNRYRQTKAYGMSAFQAACVVPADDLPARIEPDACFDFLGKLRERHAERILTGELDPKWAAKPCECQVALRALAPGRICDEPTS